MCRNIKPLFNFAPPATTEEIELSSVQFVRKISGFSKPSKSNQRAFDRAVRDIARVTRRLITSLETAAPSRNRQVEAAKAKARALARFG
ncbi:MAG: DUF2277 domain-containing protein [Bacteroidota bacterium]